jgi:hypothetical protein
MHFYDVLNVSIHLYYLSQLIVNVHCNCYEKYANPTMHMRCECTLKILIKKN